MPNSHYRNLASVVYSYSNIVLRQRLVFTLDNMFLFSLFWITEIIIGILNHLQIVLSVSTHNLSDGCCIVGLTLFVQVGRTIPPRVVAVSKKHSLEKVQWAYQKGLRHFGENYVRLLECILCDCDVGLFPLETPYILSTAQNSCKLVKLHHDCKTSLHVFVAKEWSVVQWTQKGE